MNKTKAQYARVPIGSLELDPNNANTHPETNLEAIAGSLREFGQQRPILVSRAHVVIAGNGTLMAAKRLGWTEIDVRYTDLDTQRAMAFALADNRSSELADWDRGILGQQLQSLLDDGFNIAAIGFDPGDWLGEISLKDAEDEDKPKKPKTCPECGHQWS